MLLESYHVIQWSMIHECTVDSVCTCTVRQSSSINNQNGVWCSFINACSFWSTDVKKFRKTWLNLERLCCQFVHFPGIIWHQCMDTLYVLPSTKLCNSKSFTKIWWQILQKNLHVSSIQELCYIRVAVNGNRYFFSLFCFLFLLTLHKFSLANCKPFFDVVPGIWMYFSSTAWCMKEKKEKKKRLHKNTLAGYLTTCLKWKFFYFWQLS